MSELATYVKHVLHVIRRNKWIIDSHNLNFWLVASSAKDQATNATEAVDTDLDGGPIEKGKKN